MVESVRRCVRTPAFAALVFVTWAFAAAAFDAAVRLAAQEPSTQPSASVLAVEATDEASRFRIDSTIRIVQDEKILEIKSSTIFSDRLVIDFIGDNGEIIVFDRKEQLFTLIDPIHRIQTELTLEEVNEFLTNIRGLLAEKKDRFCRFMLAPEFEVSKNDESGEMLFESKWIDYKIVTRSFDEPKLAEEYFTFSEAYLRLNIFLNPGTLTPLARARVNETLRQENRFPAKIHQTIFPKGKWLFARIIEIQNDSKLVRRLSEDDQGKIVRAMHFARQFPKMTYGNYCKAIAEAE